METPPAGAKEMYLIEEIAYLRAAMEPFAKLVKETDGRIPTERLSFAHWHQLAKAFDGRNPDGTPRRKV